MKRIISLLIMLFIVASLVLPISTINNTKKEENDVVKPILLSDIIYKTRTLEVAEIEPTPISDPYEVAMENMQTEMVEIESITDKKEWFLAYKDIVFKYAEWLDPPETVWDYFTEDEVRLVCQVVETECYDGDFDSKCNVASVVFNRFYSGEFGDTLQEVITTPHQFAYFRENITEDSILAVMYAFEIEDTANGALFFHSNDKTDEFCRADYMFTDDIGHHFYK